CLFPNTPDYIGIRHPFLSSRRRRSTVCCPHHTDRQRSVAARSPNPWGGGVPSTCFPPSTKFLHLDQMLHDSLSPRTARPFFQKGHYYYHLPALRLHRSLW